MATFILPTSGPATYRGKFPYRARSVSLGRATGLHVELNDGTRLWTATAEGRPERGADFRAMLDSAVPMTAEQYERLRKAAELMRDRARRPERTESAKRAELEAEARALVVSILPDEKAEAVKAELFAAYGTDRAELEAEAKAEAETGAPPVRLVQTRGPDGESRLVRRDNVEYHEGRAAYRLGEAQEDGPYSAGGERAARWNLGWREAKAEADEREAAEADERAAKVSPDAARALGAQSCACNLDRSANPFPADSAAGEAWDSGYSEAMADWRAERRAEIADRYGDEAADHF